MFFVVGVYLAKASVLMLYKRLSDLLFSHIVWMGLKIGLLSCGIASFLLVALTCDLTQPWLQYTRKCPMLEAQWQAVSALNIATEVALVALAIFLVWGLQMSIRSKVKVVCAFAAQIPWVIPSESIVIPD